MKPGWRYYVAGFGVLMAFDTLSQLCFKLAAVHALPFSGNWHWAVRVLAEPWVYGAIVGYLGAFVTYLGLLRNAPVGPAFAASHLNVVSVMLASALLLHERLSLPQVAGATLIVAGILTLASAGTGDAAP